MKAFKFNHTFDNEFARTAARRWLEGKFAEARRRGPFAEIVDLTPALAEVILEINPDNRRLKKDLITQITTDILEQNFLLNGETMIFSINGNLNDGQHRCAAVVRAGVSVKTFVVFGIERDTRLTVDTGKARTAADFMSMENVANATTVAVAANYLWQLENKEIGRGRATKSQVRDTFFKYQAEIEEAVKIVKWSKDNTATIFGSRGLGSFIALVLRRVDPVEALKFLEAIQTGANLSPGSPILYARSRLIGDSRSNKVPGAAIEKLELIIRAWNLWRDGKSIKSIPLTGNIPDPR